ncbi:MAG: hypothetical protein LKE74_04980 [Prevotella sp.]|nr:hypothetical protein [Prevotella sp.]MCH4017795.1 hypothetical protein [Prevotella sp.]
MVRKGTFSECALFHCLFSLTVVRSITVRASALQVWKRRPAEAAAIRLAENCF